MDSHIPRASIFQFENYWADFPSFFNTVKEHWHSNLFLQIWLRQYIYGKFKQLRRGLKKWRKELSQLNKIINNCSWVLAFLDGLEDERILSVAELDFRKLFKKH
jgi:hypothetical protein